jgi:SAM-dependent methyltransferase
VNSFYERHPYPPPVDDLDRYRERWADPQRRRASVFLCWPVEAYREDRGILVAGCGTSQAAKYALRWPRARVTGIDVSPSSLRETDTLKVKYGLDNLELRELPVERASELGGTFESVVCTGVLHHLGDPVAGLRALRDVLEPSGALHLMVYAPFGRVGVYLIQDYCRRLGIGSTTQEIRDLASSLSALPQNHPLAPLLCSSPDFRTEAGLADALLHPQDRPFSVPELFDFIEEGGLRFGRWIRQAPYLPHCGALAASPHHTLLTRLPLREQYAAVELFRGTMVRHSAVVFRDDQPGEAQPIDFAGEAWRDYVPLREPGTVCVEDRLPPGAAAVLINPAHSYRDIYLPIDSSDKRMLDAIDGKATIGQIAREHGDSASARSLFERLWCFDQVVFDASRTGVRLRGDTAREIAR